MPSDALREAYAYCESLVREQDKDRYIATLFAPPEARPRLFALYAFNLEVARVRDMAHEAAAGEIRLQWWHDALHGVAEREAGANPVARALIDALAATRLAPAPLTDLIEARRLDLYAEPIATLAELDDYAARTSSGLMLTAARLLGADSEVVERCAHAAGIAYALTGLLSVAAWHAARGQVFVPRDMLARHGVQLEEVLAGHPPPGWSAALADLRAHARAAYADLIAQAAALPEAAKPALLPAALVPRLLKRMERTPYDPRALVQLPAWQRPWVLWRAARRGFPKG